MKSWQVLLVMKDKVLQLQALFDTHAQKLKTKFQFLKIKRQYRQKQSKLQPKEQCKNFQVVMFAQTKRLSFKSRKKKQLIVSNALVIKFMLIVCSALTHMASLFNKERLLVFLNTSVIIQSNVSVKRKITTKRNSKRLLLKPRRLAVQHKETLTMF